MLQKANTKFYVPLGLSLSILLAYIGTSLYGPGMSPDSITYWSAAQSFRESFELLKVDGSPYTNWPPLYPFLLSIFPSDYFMQAARWINILGFAYCCLITTLIISRQQPKKLVYYLFAMCLSFPMLKLASMVWSETIFLALILTAIYCYQRYLLVPKTSWIAACLMLLGLSCIQRYVGVFLSFGFVSVILFTQKSKLKFGIALLAFFPLAAWLIRNTLLNDTSKSMGIHTDFGLSNLLYNIQQCLLLLPINKQLLHPLTWFIITLLLCVLIFSLFMLYKMNKQTLRFPILIGILCYTAVSLTFAPLSPFELFRYLCILYPLCLVLFSDYILRTKHATSNLQPILLSFIILIQLPIIGTQLRSWLTTGAGGYNKIEWQNPIAAAFILEVPQTENIASNAPDYIYFLTQRRTFFLNPHSVSLANTILWFPNITRNQEYWDQLQKEGFNVTQSLNGCLVLQKTK